MEIREVDALAGLRAALEAPEGERDGVFLAEVMEPLRPAWEPLLARMGAPTPEGDGLMELARRYAMYRPECGVKAGLEALGRFEAAGTMGAAREALSAAAAALDPESHGLSLDEALLTVVLADPHHSMANDKAGDYTGVSGPGGLVWVQAWPTEYNLPRLPAAAAHELHHNVRFQFEPFIPHTTTVGQYAVAEGLAESFAGELVGWDCVGPWTNAVPDEELAAVRARFREGLHRTGFAVIRGYIFGDWAAGMTGYEPQGLPDFAGYCIGYRTVRAYMERTGRTAAEATYVPWDEIVEESGYL